MGVLGAAVVVGHATCALQGCGLQRSMLHYRTPTHQQTAMLLRTDRLSDHQNGKRGGGGRGLCRLGKRGDCGRISFTHSRTGGGGGKTGTRSCCAAIQNQRRGGRSKGRGAHHRKGGEGLVLCRRGTRSNTGRIGQRGRRDTARTQAWPLHRHPRHRVPSFVRVGRGGGGTLADCT